MISQSVRPDEMRYSFDRRLYQTAQNHFTLVNSGPLTKGARYVIDLCYDATLQLVLEVLFELPLCQNILTYLVGT